MAYGQIREGQLAAAQSKAQNDIAKYNAQQLEREAKSRMEAAHIEADRVSRQARLFKGAQRAAFGKSGLSLSEGSPLEVQADTAYQFAMDRALTLRAGVVDSTRLKNQAAITRVEGKWAQTYGKQQRTTAYMKAGATILGGGYTSYRAGSGGTGWGNLNSGTSYTNYSGYSGGYSAFPRGFGDPFP